MSSLDSLTPFVRYAQSEPDNPISYDRHWSEEQRLDEVYLSSQLEPSQITLLKQYWTPEEPSQEEFNLFVGDQGAIECPSYPDLVGLVQKVSGFKFPSVSSPVVSMGYFHDGEEPVEQPLLLRSFFTRATQEKLESGLNPDLDTAVYLLSLRLFGAVADSSGFGNFYTSVLRLAGYREETDPVHETYPAPVPSSAGLLAIAANWESLFALQHPLSLGGSSVDTVILPSGPYELPGDSTVSSLVDFYSLWSVDDFAIAMGLTGLPLPGPRARSWHPQSSVQLGFGNYKNFYVNVNAGGDSVRFLYSLSPAWIYEYYLFFHVLRNSAIQMNLIKPGRQKLVYGIPLLEEFDYNPISTCAIYPEVNGIYEGQAFRHWVYYLLSRIRLHAPVLQANCDLPAYDPQNPTPFLAGLDRLGTPSGQPVIPFLAEEFQHVWLPKLKGLGRLAVEEKDV